VQISTNYTIRQYLYSVNRKLNKIFNTRREWWIINPELYRKENETELQHHKRIIYGKLVDKTLSDEDYTDLSEVAYGQRLSSDVARREFYGSKQTLDIVDRDRENKISDDDYFKELEIKKQELEKQTVRMRDERNELNKRLRDSARLEHRLDLLEDEIKKQGIEQFKAYSPTITESNNDLLVILSDLHIGAEHYSFTGCYNSDIAKERLQKYLDEIINIKNIHNSENCYVTILGDNISGSIHKTIAVSNRENVIEQVKMVSELISNFVYELSKHFNNVYVNSVNGNHSRLERKEDAMKDERLDSIPIWFAKNKLEHIVNIKIETEEIDSTMACMQIRDNTYVSLHGDYDSFTDGAVAKLVLWLGFRPDVVLFGHKHYPAMSEVAGITMVQSGSLVGSGDDFTTSRRLKGNASQTVLVCDNNGIKACYPIKLN